MMSSKYLFTEDGMPPISVVIPLYNKGPHIARTINSVLAQTVNDFEIVVVDDGSTDNGAEIVASFNDPRIRLIRQENRGVSAARNRGIQEVQSDFIAFLDADDEWEKDHLETLLRLRADHPKAGAYTTAYFHVYPRENVVPAKFKAIPPPPWEGIIPDYFKAAALGEPPVCSSAVGIPRKIFDEVGYFKVGEKMGEDLDMWFRVALNHSIAFSWDGVSVYRKDSDNRACEQSATDYSLIIKRCLSALESQNYKNIESDLQIFLIFFGRIHIRCLLRQHRGKEIRETIRAIKNVLGRTVIFPLEFGLSLVPPILIDTLLKLRKIL